MALLSETFVEGLCTETHPCCQTRSSRDVLLATPVFSNLRRAYPNAELHALTGAWSRVVLERHPDVNSVVEYNSPAFCRTGQPTSLRETFKLYRQLRRQKYELMVELRSDRRIVWGALLRITPKRLDRHPYRSRTS